MPETSKIQAGRDTHAASRQPPAERPLDAAELRASGVARGRALFRATQGDRDAREALAQLPDDAA